MRRDRPRFAVRPFVGTAPDPPRPPAGAWFVEEDFPPAPDRAEEYSRFCRRGYARMRQRRVVIAGLCRDVEHILPATILRIEWLAALFAAARIVVYENDSCDRTAVMLRRWAAHDRRVTAITETMSDPVNPNRRCASRAARMAAYRGRCQQEILDHHRDFDAVIVVDMDVMGGWSEAGVANTFGHDDWDVVGSNGLIYRRSGFVVNALRQYDTWAYRSDEQLRPLPSRNIAPFVPERGTPPIRVGSCFGGLGVYRMEAFAAGRYDGNDCEHVTFHRTLRGRGFSRIFLNPSQITLYGRRHRSADRAVGCVLRAWSRLGGSAPREWLFPPGHLPSVPTVGAVGPGRSARRCG